MDKNRYISAAASIFSKIAVTLPRIFEEGKKDG